ncbi:serpin family protein [Turkeypox virus]|uniref:Serpin family protein n=1 Tax=Turkeypox virus TaxID=336486 RepID=A0A0M3ZEI8_9POXV|nr:serpin family protein [Turkeypox virus]ALA62393.1 serpin family protein [Turkeypox virus]
MSEYLDISLSLCKINKGRTIVFSPYSIHNILSMSTVLVNNGYFRCSNISSNCKSPMGSYFKNIKYDRSTFPYTSVVSGRSSTSDNYVILEDDNETDYPILSNYDVLGLYDIGDIKSIMDEYTAFNNLSSLVMDNTKIANICYMVQPLPYNASKTCNIPYYWYRIIGELGITIISFYPSYRNIRVTMVISKDKNYFDENLTKDSLLDWLSDTEEIMHRSTLPFVIPSINAVSSIDVSHLIPDILCKCFHKEEKTLQYIYNNSLISIKPDSISFSSFAGAMIDMNILSGKDFQTDTDNSFIIVIEDVRSGIWLFFGLIR